MKPNRPRQTDRPTTPASSQSPRHLRHDPVDAGAGDPGDALEAQQVLSARPRPSAARWKRGRPPLPSGSALKGRMNLFGAGGTKDRMDIANFSVERMAAGGTCLQNRAVVARRHRSLARWAMRATLIVACLVFVSCSHQLDGSAPSAHQPSAVESRIIEIARQAVATNDTWGQSAEFEAPQKQADGTWSVTVWRLPKTPGGFREVSIDQNGRVTSYYRGH